MYIFQSVEGEPHEKAVELLKAAQGNKYNDLRGVESMPCIKIHMKSYVY